MKKKLTGFIIAAVMALVLCMTAMADTQETGISTGTPVMILARYALTSDYNDYTDCFYIVQNTSGTTIDVSLTSSAYSQYGYPLGTDVSTLYALGPGCVSVMENLFQTGEPIGSIQSSWRTTGSLYSPVIQNLSYTMEPVENGVSVEVTNNGSIPAKYVDGFALFFREGQLVNTGWIYFTDDDNELKPGATLQRDMMSYEPFDAVEFYMGGRADK